MTLPEERKETYILLKNNKGCQIRNNMLSECIANKNFDEFILEFYLANKSRIRVELEVE